MIEAYTGIPSDYFILGLAAVAVILLILLIVNIAKTSSLKKRLDIFMEGKDGKSLEDNLIDKLNVVSDLQEKNEICSHQIDSINRRMKDCYQKMGMVKYDALDQMGGKLSYTLALLDEENNGCVINSVHSTEGSYSYIKEIIDGNSIIGLSPEEDEALQKALNRQDQ